MNYMADGIAILILLVFAGRGVTRGLVMSVGKLVALAGGLLGAHLGASWFKGLLSAKLILPWISNQMAQNDGVYNPMDEIVAGISAAGAQSEQELIGIMEAAGIPSFSLSAGWGSLIDRMTGTGTNILETAKQLVAERVSYVLIFIIIFLVIQLAALFIFSSIDGLKNLPLVGLANKLGGGAVGLITGSIAIWAVMMVLTLFMPSATSAGGILSREVMENSRVAGQLYRLVSSFLQGI